jgi:SAM-dependent methyltransferase
VNRLRFWWRYFRGYMPWDTGQTPPEIVALAHELPPGRALDLGCGTGTSARYLAQRGWQVTGIDFIPAAIRRARQLAKAANLSIDFRVGDVTRLDGVSGPFDLAFDIGCFHNLSPVQQRAYVDRLAHVTRPGATFALYAFAPRELHGRRAGVTPDEVTQVFAPGFAVARIVQGTDTGRGLASAWYWLRRVEG